MDKKIIFTNLKKVYNKIVTEEKVKGKEEKMKVKFYNYKGVNYSISPRNKGSQRLITIFGNVEDKKIKIYDHFGLIQPIKKIAQNLINEAEEKKGQKC